MPRPERERSGVETAERVSLLFRALADEYRRAVVRSLDQRHTPIPLNALATYVAKEVFSTRERADFIEFRDKALVKLHHVHLPLLAKVDVIEIAGGRVMPGSAFTDAVDLLDETP